MALRFSSLIATLLLLVCNAVAFDIDRPHHEVTAPVVLAKNDEGGEDSGEEKADSDEEKVSAEDEEKAEGEEEKKDGDEEKKDGDEEKREKGWHEKEIGKYVLVFTA